MLLLYIIIYLFQTFHIIFGISFVIVNKFKMMNFLKQGIEKNQKELKGIHTGESSERTNMHD